MTATATEVRQRSPRLTGARRLLLIQDLAVGDMKAEDLAEKYGVEVKTIYNFADRERIAIGAAARDQADKCSGLLYSRKEARLALYDGEIERNLELISDLEESLGMVASADIVRLQGSIFKAAEAIAVETGDLPSRAPQQPQSAGVRLIIEGLDDDEAA